MAKQVAIKTASMEQNFFNRVFGWMAFALLITGGTSLYVITSASAKALIFGNPLVLIGLVVLELAAVFSLVAAINKMSLQTATWVFIGYSVLNGITLSGLALVYTGASIASAFFITAATFVFMAVYGATTKSDLTQLGQLAMAGLVGIIIASIVNIFLRNSGMELIISYIGVVVFIGLTAYDTQKLKVMLHDINGDEVTYQKFAIVGALTLYLDFVNLFIMILRIVGNRRD